MEGDREGPGRGERERKREKGREREGNALEYNLQCQIIAAQLKAVPGDEHSAL